MSRIPEKNRRFRSQAEICEDVASVLRSRLHYGTKFAVLSEVVWVWSEFSGKLKGCRYWSKAACRTKSESKFLVHEHLVPKGVIIEKLFALPSPSPKAVRRVLERYCIGVVVTRAEDKELTHLGLRSKMPGDWDKKNPWARYVAARIEVDK
jgi:hypothetical protein